MGFKFNPTTGSLDLVSSDASSAKVIFVSQDTGNDANAGTLSAPLKTIQAGINKAELTAAVFNQVLVAVTPSTSGNGYQENLTFSQQGVVLQSLAPTSRADHVLIKGNITINLTGTSGGANYVAAQNIVYIKGFLLTATSGDTLTFSGSTFQRLFLADCYLDNTGSGSAITLTNTGTSGGTKSTLTSKNNDINNGSSTNPTVRLAAGRFFCFGMTYDINNSNSSGQSFLGSGASAAGVSANISNAIFTNQVSVTDNTANIFISQSTIASGTAPSVVTPSSPSTGAIVLANVGLTSTNTNTITGSGIVGLFNNVVKLSTGGDIVSTVIQVTANSFPEGAKLLGATATQTTNALLTIKSGHIKSQQTTAPTAAPANAGSGATAVLLNATDTAGRITLTTGTGAITNTAIATVTFNKSHATAPIITLTPQNANAGANLVQAYVTATTTTFVINFVVAPTISTAYAWFYHVLETQ